MSVRFSVAGASVEFDPTAVVIAGFTERDRGAGRFRASLDDPVTGRTITFGYRIGVLDVLRSGG